MLSRFEQLARAFFQELLPDWQPIYNLRPEWLTNPRTGHPLELDIFYPDLNVAIEVNGIGHKLIYQEEKDAIKQAACREQGIALYAVKRPGGLFWVARMILGYDPRVSRRLRERIRKYRPVRKGEFHKVVTRRLKHEYPIRRERAWNKTQDEERARSIARMKAKGLPVKEKAWISAD